MLDFMRASTELSAEGTWHDPENVSHDEQADNVLIEVEFGETADEIVGRAIVAALRLKNNLAINEQVLYARMVNSRSPRSSTDEASGRVTLLDRADEDQAV